MDSICDRIIVGLGKSIERAAYSWVKTMRKLTCLLLVLVLTFSLFTLTAFADGDKAEQENPPSHLPQRDRYEAKESRGLLRHPGQGNRCRLPAVRQMPSVKIIREEVSTPWT